MPPVTVIVVSGAVFIGVLLVSGLLFWGWQGREEGRAQEISRRLGTTYDQDLESLFILQNRDPMAESFGALGTSLESLVRQTGVGLTIQGLLVRMFLWVLVTTVTLFVITKSAVCLVGLFTAFIPVLIANSQANSRAEQLSEQLPDALDLIGRSLQAGHGLSDAIRLCAEEMQPPISFEFARVYEEHNLGRDFRECLNNFSVRNPRNFDLRIFVSSVNLQRDTGGNLIEILTNISQTVRDRFVFHAKVNALTSEAKASAIILGCLPFVVFSIIFVMKRDYLAILWTDSIGNFLAALALGMFSSGAFVMYRMTQVDV